MRVKTKPLGPVGAEIIGLDLSRPLDASLQHDLYDVWLDAGVLLFRDAVHNPEEQLSLSRCFGDLAIHPAAAIRVGGIPELVQFGREGDSHPPVYAFDGVVLPGKIGWHADLIYTTTPCRGGLLRMVEAPTVGGETGWIDTASAYDALAPDVKQKIASLEVQFTWTLHPQDMRFGRPAEQVDIVSPGNLSIPDFPDVIHPLAWKHPESGRRSLNLSFLQLSHIVGMDAAESRALLQQLVDHCSEARFSYFHDWRVNDAVLWDNLRTLHSVLGHPPECSRMVHRTTIKSHWQSGRLAEH